MRAVACRRQVSHDRMTDGAVTRAADIVAALPCETCHGPPRVVAARVMAVICHFRGPSLLVPTGTLCENIVEAGE